MERPVRAVPRTGHVPGRGRDRLVAVVGPAGMSNPPPPRTTGTGVTSPTSTSQGAWVLQAGEGPIVGPYLPATPETVSWGWVRGGGAIPALTVDPGTVLTVDTISHEGILDDQGRDPLRYFAGRGVAPDAVLGDAVALAGADVPHDQERDGPHVVSGPIHVRGALPGDVVTVEILDLLLRVPYGIVSNRHGRGALPGELPARGEQGSTPAVVSRFATVRTSDGPPVAWLHGPDVSLPLPLRPFLGLVAVAPAGPAAHSVPPGPHGGNLDVRLLGRGSRLHLPVQVPGALVQVGDPHFAQGDGEVAGTALEAPLRAVIRVDLLPGAAPASGLPYGETPDAWVVLGLHEDLDEAVRIATRCALDVVERVTGADRATAFAWLSAVGDVGVSQVVDGAKGAHLAIPKDWLARAVRSGSPPPGAHPSARDAPPATPDPASGTAPPGGRP